MSLIKDLMLGFAVGDALGVPVELKDRSCLKENPVTSMLGFGTYNLPQGSWSDDTSFCIAFMSSYIMEHGNFSMFKIMTEYNNYYSNGRYSPFGKVFGLGNTSRKALENFKAGTPPVACGFGEEHDCGNGSLMRIPPLIPILKISILDDDLRHGIISDFSAVTHYHRRCIACCLIYSFVALELSENSNIEDAVEKAIIKSRNIMNKSSLYKDEYQHLERIFTGVKDLCEDEIKSTGYVVDTLEAVLWCILNTQNYKDCVLKAVNLGGDTDTIAALSGALASVVYGSDSIPAHWINTLIKKKEILKCIEDFNETLTTRFEKETK
jgi:ADP-ribosylglycohydrolase